MSKCRLAFEEYYGQFNGLDKKDNGEYVDWNLQLSFNCWERAWNTALDNH